MYDMLGAKRLMNRLKRELFPALERKIYQKNIKSVVVKKDEIPVIYLVYDKNDKIPWWSIERKGKVFPCKNILDMGKLPTEEIKITSSFWTCQCTDHFIHHKAQAKCPICKLEIWEDTQTLNVIKGG